MRSVDTSAITKILRVLGKCGPLTAKDLKKLTGLEGVQARIAEFNRVFTNIEIGSTKTRPALYFLKFPQNIKISTRLMYPDMDAGSYKLSTKKKGRK